MLIDLTMPMKPGMIFRKGSPPLDVHRETFSHEEEGTYTMSLVTTPVHIGTHIDIMDGKVELPPERFFGRGRLIDVTAAAHGAGAVISLDDCLGIEKTAEGDFVFFRTGWDKYAETETYFHHPELSGDVIEFLIERKITMAGIDALGLGLGKNHGTYDRLLADNEMYAIENLRNLDRLPTDADFRVYCFPIRLPGVEALPARIVAEV